jgi:hypothetical protein
VARWPAGTDLTLVYTSPQKGTLAMVDGVLFTFDGTNWVDFLAALKTTDTSLSARITALETAPPYFGLNRTVTTAFNVPTATMTDIGGWSTQFGSATPFSYSAGHITIPSTGLYRFDIGITFRSGSTTGQRVIILGTGSADSGTRLAISQQIVPYSTSLHTLCEIHETLSLTAGQVVYLYAYQTSGSTVSLFDDTTPGYRDYWQVRKIG